MPVTAGDGTWTALIAAFSSNPAMLLLALVLMGIGFGAYKLLGGFLRSMAKSLKEMTEHMAELRKDIAVIAERVATHEVRIKRLEDRE